MSPLPPIDLDKTDIPPALIALVPRAVAHEYMMVPVSAEGRTLTIAASRPLDSVTLDVLRFILYRDVNQVLASAESIRRALTRCYGIRWDEPGGATIMATTRIR